MIMHTHTNTLAMDPVVEKAKTALRNLSEFFSTHPPELQWSRDAQLLAQVQVSILQMIVSALLNLHPIPLSLPLPPSPGTTAIGD